jgi:2-amino-4-hydroxy-6-hydroxymethyldihydropteridine diphosphokinase
MNTALIGVGSNINPQVNIDRAEQLLKQKLHFVACASRLQTKPLGFAAQPDFINSAFLIETEFDEAELKLFLKATEKLLARVRGPNKNGPRTIDLDILVFNSEIVDDDVYERDFLRKLIAEVFPDLGNKPRV